MTDVAALIERAEAELWARSFGTGRRAELVSSLAVALRDLQAELADEHEESVHLIESRARVESMLTKAEAERDRLREALHALLNDPNHPVPLYLHQKLYAIQVSLMGSRHEKGTLGDPAAPLREALRDVMDAHRTMMAMFNEGGWTQADADFATAAFDRARVLLSQERTP